MHADTARFHSGDLIPNFVLPRCDAGTALELRSLKPRHNLVLLFAHGGDCGGCRALVDRFAAGAAALREQNAEVIVILHARPEDVSAWSGITLLCDQDGAVTRAYLGAASADVVAPVGLFITDRWQALREWRIVADEAEVPEIAQVLERLAAIESECPECAPVSFGWGEDIWSRLYCAAQAKALE